MKRSDLLRWLKKTRIAVLKGGWSSERAISLKTGQAVEGSLQRQKISFHSIDVNRNFMPVLQKKKIQFCFVALHGPFGEDGRIQSCLDILNIRYTGSGPLASALAMDKDLSKKVFREQKIPTPPWAVVRKTDSLVPVQALLSQGPVFVKPVDQGSAIGASRVDKKSQLPPALKNCFRVSNRALIERFIPGKELTVGILGDETLPAIGIVPAHAFYDFHSKYAKGGSRHIVPADISSQKQNQARQLATQAFRALGCEVYGRVDLIMKPNGQFQVLEVNTIPGMTATSLLPEAAQAIGINFDELVLRIIEGSLQKRT